MRTLNWPVTDKNVPMITVETNNSLIDEEILNQKLNKEKSTHLFGWLYDYFWDKLGLKHESETHKVLVEVSMLRTNWIFR